MLHAPDLIEIHYFKGFFWVLEQYCRDYLVRDRKNILPKKKLEVNIFGRDNLENDFTFSWNIFHIALYEFYADYFYRPYINIRSCSMWNRSRTGTMSRPHVGF